jgi:hypothetical protein
MENIDLISYSKRCCLNQKKMRRGNNVVFGNIPFSFPLSYQAQIPFVCNYDDGSGYFTGEADIETINTLDNLPNINCQPYYA